MSSAIAKAAPLKAEIRLAQAVSQFEADLPPDQKAAFRSHRSQSCKTPPDAHDVMRLTARIDRETSKNTLGGRCFGPRFTNVLQVVQQFAALGDLIVGGSQNIIACGVWSLVRTTLLSLVNHSSCMDKLSHLLMVAGRSAPRYQKMALLYPRSKLLQSNLSEYFIIVVQLCHHLLRMAKRTVFGQLASLLSDPEMKSYESDLVRWGNAIKEEANLLMSENVDDQTSRVKMLLRFSESESHRRKLNARCQLLDSCSTYDYETSWKETRKAGNVTLLDSAPEYGRWRSESGSSTLLCRGKLGAGKSVLLANIVDNLNLHVPDSKVPVTYFFCRHDIAESLKARTILGSLARQLLRAAPSVSTEATIDATMPTLNCERLLELLRRSLPAYLKAYFVLDGLDECGEEERNALLQYIPTLQSMFSLLICLSFRVEASITPWPKPSAFTNLLVMSIPEENPDIACFISSQLERTIESGQLKVGDPRIVLEIEDALLQGGNGMFLWVTLQIESLCGAKTDEAIRQALADLPKDLPQTFQRVLQRSGGSGRHYQIPIFKLITAALRPLTVEELQEALSVIPGDTTWDPTRSLNDVYSVLSYCGSLVTINEESLTLTLVHHSVKQFLLGGSSSFESGLFTSKSAHQEMGRIIVTYLNYGVFDTSLSTQVVPQISSEESASKIIKSLDTRSTVQSIALRFLQSRRQPAYNMGKTLADAAWNRRPCLEDRFYFHSYAKSYWLDHILCSDTGHDQVMSSLVVKLITLYHLSDHSGYGLNREQSLIGWAAKSGSETIVRALIEAGSDVDSRDASGLTPLCWAISSGHKDIVELLLNGSLKYRMMIISCPLTFGVLAKHQHIASLLLHHGADPLIRLSLGEALLSLQKSNSKSSDIPEILEHVFSQYGSESTSSYIRRALPLVLAVAAGDESVVELLLSYEAMDRGQRENAPALEYAAFRHNSIIAMILVNGVPIENLQAPLALAIKKHDIDMVRLLLDSGVNIDTGVNENGDAIVPLFVAIEQHQEDIVRLLLENGADVSSHNVYGKSPLLAAIEDGDLSIIRVLLKFHQDANMKKEIAVARQRRDDSTLRLILNRGAELRFPIDKQRALLAYAASVGCDDVVRRLIAEGADVNYLDSESRTPLSHAIQHGQIGIIKQLARAPNFSRDGCNFPDKMARTPLSYAVQVGMTEIVSLLLRLGFVTNIGASSGGSKPKLLPALRLDVHFTVHSPLVSAILAGSVEIIKLLVLHGVDVWVADYKTGLTPLATAQNCGRVDIVDILRERMAQDPTRWSPDLLEPPCYELPGDIPKFSNKEFWDF